MVSVASVLLLAVVDVSVADDIVDGVVKPPLLDVTSLADPSLPEEQAAREAAISKFVILGDMRSRYVAGHFPVNAAKRATPLASAQKRQVAGSGRKQIRTSRAIAADHKAPAERIRPPQTQRRSLPVQMNMNIVT
ncbi:MAG TPA: hypothetical protein ENJ18_06280 [Nannocystis exedens]|nr:hypothetical protein [Nannocystis exedens]